MDRINLFRNQLKSVSLLSYQLPFIQNQTSNSFFSHVPKAPLDQILGVGILFKKDTDPRKVDLGIGAYRTEEGKPYVFEVVKEAEKRLEAEISSGKVNLEYQSSEGNVDYCEFSKKIVWGADLYGTIKSKTVTTQSLGGTGALRISADFLKVFKPGSIYLPKPTWGNHNNLFKRAGLTVEEYPYWNPKTKGLDIDGLLKRLNEIPEKSTVLLHACAHNPTGVDPSQDQWRQIAKVMKAKNHFPLFDNAYQGFASGDLHKDAFAIRLFTELGFQMIVTQSYSKTFGLYGERAGAFHLLTDSETTAENCLTQLRIVIRVNYSNPPIHVMRVVSKILACPNLYSKWTQELAKVAGRINEMRKLLREELEKINTPGNWDIITNQIGMFSYTGLSKEQCEKLVNEHHIYLINNGRISMSGITKKNVGYIAQSIKKCF